MNSAQGVVWLMIACVFGLNWIFHLLVVNVASPLVWPLLFVVAIVEVGVVASLIWIYTKSAKKPVVK